MKTRRVQVTFTVPENIDTVFPVVVFLQRAITEHRNPLDPSDGAYTTARLSQVGYLMEIVGAELVENEPDTP